MTPCRCNQAAAGSCFLLYDQIIHGLNRKLIEKPSRLGWYAFAQEEARRLHKKGDWMERLGVEDTKDVECECA